MSPSSVLCTLPVADAIACACRTWSHLHAMACTMRRWREAARREAASRAPVPFYSFRCPFYEDRLFVPFGLCGLCRRKCKGLVGERHTEHTAGRWPIVHWFPTFHCEHCALEWRLCLFCECPDAANNAFSVEVERRRQPRDPHRTLVRGGALMATDVATKAQYGGHLERVLTRHYADGVVRDILSHDITGCSGPTGFIYGESVDAEQWYIASQYACAHQQAMVASPRVGG